jgi:hypothetical protein
MNDPIFSPWLVYFIMQMSTATEIIYGVFGLSILSLTIAGISRGITWGDLNTNEEATIKRWIRRNLIFLAIIAPVAMFAPTQKTLIAIAVNSVVTPANMEISKQTTEDMFKWFDGKVESLIDLLKEESSEQDAAKEEN